MNCSVCCMLNPAWWWVIYCKFMLNRKTEFWDCVMHCFRVVVYSVALCWWYVMPNVKFDRFYFLVPCGNFYVGYLLHRAESWNELSLTPLRLTGWAWAVACACDLWDVSVTRLCVNMAGDREQLQSWQCQCQYQWSVIVITSGHWHCIVLCRPINLIVNMLDLESVSVSVTV